MISAGNYAETAAAYAGINKVTFYDWLKSGANKKGKKFENFSNAVQKALAEAEVIDVLRIREASKIHWQASAWRLERKHQEKWGRQEKLKHEHNAGQGGGVVLYLPDNGREDPEDDNE